MKGLFYILCGRSLRALVVLASACSAQAFTGSLTGLITDPNNAELPNANDSLRKTAAGEWHQTQTRSPDHYTPWQLLPGVYDLAVSAPGFRTAVQQDIALRAALAAEVDVAMGLGALVQGIQVEVAPIVLETQSGDRSLTLGPSQVPELPLNFRLRFGLAGTRAGVVGLNQGLRDSIRDQNRSRYNIAGSRYESHLVMVYGLPMTSADFSALIAAPSVDWTGAGYHDPRCESVPSGSNGWRAV